jgi:hypothetical protein
LLLLSTKNLFSAMKETKECYAIMPMKVEEHTNKIPIEVNKLLDEHNITHEDLVKLLPLKMNITHEIDMILGMMLLSQSIHRTILWEST